MPELQHQPSLVHQQRELQLLPVADASCWNQNVRQMHLLESHCPTNQMIAGQPRDAGQPGVASQPGVAGQPGLAGQPGVAGQPDLGGQSIMEMPSLGLQAIADAIVDSMETM